MAHDEHFDKDIAYHAQIAGEYDQIITEPREYPNDLLFAPLDPHIAQGKRMLDLGCGTGQMILRYGERFDSVIGVDHSPEMLAQARSNISKRGLEDVKLVETNLFDFLASDEGSYDFVSCVGCLHHLPLESIPRVFELVSARLHKEAVFLLAEPIDVNLDALPPEIEDWNAESIMKDRAYTVEVEDPEEAPISQAFLRANLAKHDFRIVAESRGWELFPHHWPPSDGDRKTIRALHDKYGETGNILCLVGVAG
jgi:SAM-dependent methyltransferase